mgnify:CR=1 FL=1
MNLVALSADPAYPSSALSNTLLITAAGDGPTDGGTYMASDEINADIQVHV